MIPHGGLPHPWWQFWQIGDFLIMLAVVVFFVRFVRRSDAQAGSEESTLSEEERPTKEDSAAGATRASDGHTNADRPS